MNVIWKKVEAMQLVETIAQVMEEKFEDYTQVRKRYLAAVETLKKTQGDHCKDETDAINRQLRTIVLFSGMLGLKANFDHFADPVARSFLDVDSEVYLREETSYMLPEYEKAQMVRNAFYARLSPAEQELYGDVLDYSCYWETVAPKLAHYYGYILGNELFPLVIPGYHPDTVQTAQYKAMLNRYFGKSFA